MCATSHLQVRPHPTLVAGHCLHAALLVMAGSEASLPSLARTHWNEGMPGYAHVLAMYAFGLAENADHAGAMAWVGTP